MEDWSLDARALFESIQVEEQEGKDTVEEEEEEDVGVAEVEINHSFQIPDRIEEDFNREETENGLDNHSVGCREQRLGQSLAWQILGDREKWRAKEIERSRCMQIARVWSREEDDSGLHEHDPGSDDIDVGIDDEVDRCPPPEPPDRPNPTSQAGTKRTQAVTELGFSNTTIQLPSLEPSKPPDSKVIVTVAVDELPEMVAGRAVARGDLSETKKGEEHVTVEEFRIPGLLIQLPLPEPPDYEDVTTVTTEMSSTVVAIEEVLSSGCVKEESWVANTGEELEPTLVLMDQDQLIEENEFSKWLVARVEPTIVEKAKVDEMAIKRLSHLLDPVGQAQICEVSTAKLKTAIVMIWGQAQVGVSGKGVLKTFQAYPILAGTCQSAITKSDIGYNEGVQDFSALRPRKILTTNSMEDAKVEPEENRETELKILNRERWAFLTCKMFPIAVTWGNTLFLKPYEKNPRASMILAALAIEAGLPEGVLNIVHGTHEIVNYICSDKDIKAVSFFGPIMAGMHFYARASTRGKSVQSNAGGINHVVLDATLDALIPVGFSATGDRNMALNTTVLVGGSMRWEEELVQCAKILRVTAGTDLSADHGPVISKEEEQRICRLVQFTKASTRHKLGGLYDSPWAVMPEMQYIEEFSTFGIGGVETYGEAVGIDYFRDTAKELETASWDPGGHYHTASITSSSSVEVWDPGGSWAVSFKLHHLEDKVIFQGRSIDRFQEVMITEME